VRGKADWRKDNDGKDGNDLGKMGKPLGFESFDIPVATHAPLPSLPTSILSDLNDNKISNIKPRSFKSFERNSDTEFYARPSLDVTNVSNSLYPSWVVNKSDELKTCANLLSYVPVTPKQTIDTISLDNCSLPVLTVKATSPEDLLTDTLNRFKTSSKGSNAQPIRKICPETCQAVQCPSIPPIPTNLSTPSPTNAKITSIWEIPINKGSNLIFKVDKSLTDDKIDWIKIDDLEGILDTKAESAIKNLFSLGGIDTIKSVTQATPSPQYAYNIDHVLNDISTEIKDSCKSTLRTHIQRTCGWYTNNPSECNKCIGDA
jgi:hypothetical protein